MSIRSTLPLIALCFTSCSFLPHPIATIVPHHHLSATVDVTGKIYAIVDDSWEGSIYEYVDLDGDVVANAIWPSRGGILLQVDATARANELWVHRGFGELEVIERVLVRTNPSRIQRNAQVPLADILAFDSIEDIAAGPSDALYLVGEHSTRGHVIARCVVFHGICGSFTYEPRRADTRALLREPMKIEVDMATGDIYVIDGSAAVDLLRYAPPLARTGAAALRITPSVDHDVDVAALADLVVTADFRNSRLTLYEHLRPNGRSTNEPLYPWDTYSGVAFRPMLIAGRKLSDTCGYFFEAHDRDLDGRRRTQFTRHLVGTDCP